jgi:CDP-paratose 2-epimerase
VTLVPVIGRPRRNCNAPPARSRSAGPGRTRLSAIPTAIVTGSGGLIGSETVKHFVAQGFDVVGLENDMRARFFGPEASTAANTRRLVGSLDSFRSLDVDIRDADAVEKVVRDNAAALELIVHTAAQPSHDWAAREPHTDFTVNANGTLNLLEAARRHKPDATFVFTSTNKVYGDRPNDLPLRDIGSRLELPQDHEYFQGIPITMSIDHTMHSLFGASKLAADVLVQEYGRYFGMPTVCFRGGCLTGPAHAGTQLHGFLSYLMKCTVTGDRYTVFGHEGKQVRDNIHAADVVQAFGLFHASPRSAAVYNLGGGRQANVSMLEAIEKCQRIAGRELCWKLSDQARAGDHRWWISDLSDFERDHPSFRITYGIDEVLQEIHDANLESWAGTTA